MNMHFQVLLVLIGVNAPSQLAGFLMGPRCLLCQSASSILECASYAVCNPHEVCYVQKRTDDMGGEFVDAGCRPRQVCDLLGCFKENNSSDRAKRSTLWSAVTCHHCCDGDFCNLNGCQDSLTSDGKIVQCFECDAAHDPSQCDHIRSCEDNEECYTTMMYEGILPRYRMGCMKRAMCDMLKAIVGNRERRDTMLESDCCSSHLCNREMPPVKDPPAPTVSYHCPTKSIIPHAEPGNSSQ